MDLFAEERYWLAIKQFEFEPKGIFISQLLTPKDRWEQNVYAASQVVTDI